MKFKFQTGRKLEASVYYFGKTTLIQRLELNGIFVSEEIFRLSSMVSYDCSDKQLIRYVFTKSSEKMKNTELKS